jgi:hypothetical protein
MSTYEELLEEARTKVQSIQQSTAQEYVPKMYRAFRDANPDLASEDARDRIEKDCVGIWSKRTILDALPDEAKDLKKQKAGRLRQKGANSAAPAAAHLNNKKSIILENNGVQKTNPTEDAECHPYGDNENSRANWKLKAVKDCRSCTILRERNEILINKVEDYEQIIKEASLIQTADKINPKTSDDGIRSVAISGNVESNPTYCDDEVLNIEHYFPWLELEKYIQGLYKSGNPLKVLFNLRIEKKSGKVREAHFGSIG